MSKRADKEWGEMWSAEGAIGNLPPAQPSVSKTETVEDCISRQAAISHVDDAPYIKEHPSVGLLWKAWIESLPSAQPEQHWIPCSERLPEEKQSIFAKYRGTAKWQKSFWEKQSDIVLVAIACKDGYKLVTTARTIDGDWSCDHLAIRGSKVIAWQPLPEPPEE